MIASHDRLRPERLGNAQSIGKAKQVRARARTPLSGRILAEIPHLRAYARLMTNDDAKRIRGSRKHSNVYYSMETGGL